MNNLIANLLAGAQNAHIRWPILGAVALELIPIWFPAYKTQCAETQKALLAYGLVAAANAVQPQTAKAIQAVQAVAVADNPTPAQKEEAKTAVDALPAAKK